MAFGNQPGNNRPEMNFGLALVLVLFIRLLSIMRLRGEGTRALTG